MLRFSSQVISGVQPNRVRPRSEKVVEEKDLEEENELMRVYAKPLREPILGEHFQYPAYNEPQRRIKLETFSSPLAKFTPVYSHMKVYEANRLELPSTTKRLTAESYLSREPTTSARKDIFYVLNQEHGRSIISQEDVLSESSCVKNS